LLVQVGVESQINLQLPDKFRSSSTSVQVCLKFNSIHLFVNLNAIT